MKISTPISLLSFFSSSNVGQCTWLRLFYANNNVYICSIPSKFHILWMYYRINNMYTKYKWNIQYTSFLRMRSRSWQNFMNDPRMFILLHFHFLLMYVFITTFHIDMPKRCTRMVGSCHVWDYHRVWLLPNGNNVIFIILKIYKMSLYKVILEKRTFFLLIFKHNQYQASVKLKETYKTIDFINRYKSLRFDDGIPKRHASCFG